MKNLINDWQTFFKSLDANQKVSLVIASLVVVGGMIALVVWSQTPQMRLLYGALSEKDAASIVNHLEAQGITYEMRSGGRSIFVPEKDVYKARMDVVSQGVVQGDAVGYEIFDKSSFGASDFIQRTNFIRAIQGELARTIAQLRGVQSARVMVVMPDNRLLLVNNNLETTASVFVDVGGGSISDAAVKSIQALVANSVEGLAIGNVAVVDNHGNVLSEEREEDALMAGSASILEYRESIEGYFSKKVESMLERVIGHGNAVVRVFAEIDSDQMSRTQEEFDETSPVVRSQSSQVEVRTTVESSGGGVEGAGPIATPGKTDEEVTSKDQEYEIDKTVTNVVRAPGSVRRLTASVFVAAKAVVNDGIAEAAAQVSYETRTPEQLNQLRTIVANALGIDPEDESTGSVTIQEMAFAGDPISMLANAPADESFDLMEILQFGEEIMGTIVAIVLFLIFFQMYRKFKSQPSPFEELKQQAVRYDRTGAQAAAAEVTPELLNELIRQKPENAAVTLRGWLKEKESE